MYGYTDPYEAARKARQQIQPSAPYPPRFPGVPEGPLADIQNQVAGVLNAADPQRPYLPGPGGTLLPYPGTRRQPSVLRDMAYGAAAGFAGWLVWQRLKRRRATKSEYTSPGFRGLGFLLVFPVIGFLLSMLWIPESGYFLGWGCVLGAVSFIAYAVYRVAGHGRYNTRRPGGPWRQTRQGRP